MGACCPEIFDSEAVRIPSCNDEGRASIRVFPVWAPCLAKGVLQNTYFATPNSAGFDAIFAAFTSKSSFDAIRRQNVGAHRTNKANLQTAAHCAKVPFASLRSGQGAVPRRSIDYPCMTKGAIILVVPFAYSTVL